VSALAAALPWESPPLCTDIRTLDRTRGFVSSRLVTSRRGRRRLEVAIGCAPAFAARRNAESTTTKRGGSFPEIASGLRHWEFNRATARVVLPFVPNPGAPPVARATTPSERGHAGGRRRTSFGTARGVWGFTFPGSNKRMGITSSSPGLPRPRAFPFSRELASSVRPHGCGKEVA
jgi:hypothetical protein